ncbi:helix-turn-helix transcriptional regulator [Oscillospiraceae bacterium MB08-C2-2]|nr:helix-turn-helix transcriptional regulator [Oscillospiraceae bacterium MB08-C2-2]
MARKHENKYVQLALNIAYYRKKEDLTQEQLAEAVGVSRTHISNIEATKMDKSVSLDVLFDIADALKVGVGALFEIR